MGEDAEEDGLLGAILASDGCNLGTQFTVNVLEAAEFLDVEFWDYLVKQFYWQQGIPKVIYSNRLKSMSGIGILFTASN